MVPIVEVGEHGDRPYYVMPWYRRGSLEGADLGDVSSRLRLLHDVAGVLEDLHSRGYAHRDIKPENLLLDEDRRPVLADFGLCLQLEDERVTEIEEAVGSRFFIAPENESGINEEVDQRPADAYAFGKLLWSVMTGSSALPRELQLEADRSIATLLRNDRLDGLDQLCRLLLGPDPRTRLSDWSTVRDEIHAVLRRAEGQEFGDLPRDDADLNTLIPSLRKLSRARTVEPHLRAERQAAAERESCQALIRTFVARLHTHLDAELDALAPALEEAGLSVTLSSGGLFLKHVATRFGPLRGRPEMANLRPWAGDDSTMVALYIRTTRQPWSPWVWVGMYLVPHDMEVAIARVANYQRNEHDSPVFVTRPGAYWDLTACGRWDLATSKDRVLEVADSTATFLRHLIGDYIADAAAGSDPSVRYLTG